MTPYASADPWQVTAVLLDGPPVALAPTAVQPLAMVLHELATNSAKPCALSTPGGLVEVRWHIGRRAGEDGLLHLHWMENGGPPIQSIPARRGFGTRVIKVPVRGQLGGSVALHWGSSRLVVEIEVPLARVVANGETGGTVDAAAAVGA
ncbi:sensor histidine kinase [Belnapia sp. F-4-1]|uniref:sensor histidine kinase n=1 Tax=Belnapia sp. F-4-1 TaxID=1545443 RepID=UPI0011867FAB|nr:sensor histidine kinase [Belnapia sp. F-4-1]